MGNEEGAIVFLRYALSAMGNCSTPKVSQEEIAVFEKVLKSGELPPRYGLNGLTLGEELEGFFPKAVKHLKSWKTEDVRDYWRRKHNEIVKDNPACGVYWGKVSEILPPQGNERNKIKLNGLEKFIFKSYILLRQGDIVLEHGSIIAEKIYPGDILKYLLPKFRLK